MVGNGCHPEKSTRLNSFLKLHVSFITSSSAPPPPHHRLSRVRCHSVVLFPHINSRKSRASQLIASLTPSCTLSYQLGPRGTPVIREKGVQSGCSNFFVCLPGSKMASRSLAGPPTTATTARVRRARVHVSTRRGRPPTSVQVSIILLGKGYTFLHTENWLNLLKEADFGFLLFMALFCKKRKAVFQAQQLS